MQDEQRSHAGLWRHGPAWLLLVISFALGPMDESSAPDLGIDISPMILPQHQRLMRQIAAVFGSVNVAPLIK